MFDSRMNERDYLVHHGILGQKWGVRRYQNRDGTLTSEGRRRLRDSGFTTKKSEKKSSVSGSIKEKVSSVVNSEDFGKKALVAAGVAVGTVLAAKMINDPDFRDLAVNKLSDTLSKAGKAATDAAVASSASIAIVKLSEKMAPSDTDSESVKNAKKIALDSASAAIRTATNTNVSGSSNNSKSVGKEVSNVVGKPSNKGIDKSSASYQALFKDNSGNLRSQEVRSTIKSMASAGYDEEQIKKYLNTLSHSGTYAFWKFVMY